MINDSIEGVEESTLSAEQKNILLGQLYFLRAWRNFLTIRWYGAIPIVDRVLDVSPSSIVPRSSAKDCFAFVLNDLRTAYELLKDTELNQLRFDSNYGRVTTGAVLALKGRVLTWWCSPLFNRKGDTTRYQEAYEEMKADKDIIDGCGYGLTQASGEDNYAAWADMFQTVEGNIEAIFLTRYNNITTDNNFRRNNPWERKIRPANAYAGGTTPSAMMVDLFPMKDGGIPDYANYFGTASKLKKSEYEYKPEYPFLNRDPRFYRTFGFPGIKWPYSGTAMDTGNKNPYNGDEYELWNYVWYLDDNEANNPMSDSQYGADNLLKSVHGMYVTKRSTGKVHSYSEVNKDSNDDAFSYSYASYIELRYAEVLLNLAEVACGAGKWQEALPYLQQIRARVGYTAANNYGLNVTDDASCMAAILYERQIEFAYEGKRIEDMRRWMLFDGGTGTVAGAPATWTLTGWGGNTCTWLGVKPFNGQHRDNMEFMVKNVTEKGADTWTDWNNMPDPIAKTLISDGTVTDWNSFKTWRSEYAVDLNNTKADELDAQLEHLQEFYNQYLTRKLKTGDLNGSNTIDYIKFSPRYYLLGIPSGALSNNTTMLQTYGWEDTQGHSEFCDPLAE